MTRPEVSAVSWGEGDFVVVLSCPGCGAEVRVPSSDRAVRCGHCRSAHLVGGRSEAAPFLVPNQIAGAIEAMEAFLEDTKRRRFLARSFEEDGDGADGWDLVSAEASRLVAEALRELLPPALAPDSSLPEALLHGEVERYGEDVRRTTSLLSYRFFFAPYWHLAGRMYELVAGRDGDGAKAMAAAVQGVEASRPAFDPTLPLPAMGRLSQVRELRPLTSAARARLPILPLVDPVGDFEGLAERWCQSRLERTLDPLARRGDVWPSGAWLVLRPFHLLELAGPSASRRLLFDGWSRRCVGALTIDDVDRLQPQTGLPGVSAADEVLGLRPMRCPECAGDLPLDRDGEVRFCSNCGRGFALQGQRLGRVPYGIELVGEMPRGLLLPFWRLSFRLRAARGQATSTAGVGELLGADVSQDPDQPWVDVPAFRPEDRRRAFEVYQHLFALRGVPGERVVEGPVTHGSGLPQPARFVSVSAREAAFAARHALALGIPRRALARVSVARLRQVLLEAPLETGVPRLLLRDFRHDAVRPVTAPLGELRGPR